LPRKRYGHTLFEVILVVTLLVVVGFLSLPLFQPLLNSNHLQGAEDLVKTRWSEMRLRAMNDARPYRFAFRENSTTFRIAPDSPEFWGEEGSSSNEPNQALVIEENLPGEILFCRSEAKDVPIKADSNQSWTRALTFLPDGTAREDVQLSFGKAGSRSQTLRVQGAIGAVTSGDNPDEGRRP
jgi:Tfp pilus assembly protein FimT